MDPPGKKYGRRNPGLGFAALLVKKDQLTGSWFWCKKHFIDYSEQ
jgi:hypothetical protein